MTWILRTFKAAAVPLACALLFLAVALPGLNLPGLHHDETYQAAEAILFLRHWRMGGPPPSVSGIGGSNWIAGRFPWMTLDYIGALKTYLFALVFLFFRPSVLTIRIVTVLLGAAAVFFTALLVEELYGTLWACGLGLWVATDPGLVLIARHDFGSVILTMALKLAGLWLIVLGARKGRWAAFSGSFLFGLALWDKSHFLWWLGALSLAAFFWVPQRDWQAKTAAAGLAAGAAPWLLFNTIHPLRTFAGLRSAASFSLSQWLRTFPELAAQRWAMVLQMLRGDGFFHGFSGEEMPALGLREGLLCGLGVLCLLALAVCVVRGRWAGLRHTAFWVTAASGIFCAACLTPLAVGLHHMPMLYPLPHLAAVSLLWSASQALRWDPTPAALAVIPLSLALAFENGALVGDFRQAVARTGGSAEWYTGLSEVAQTCAMTHAPVVVMDLMYGIPLVVYTDGDVIPAEGYPDLLSDAGFRQAVQTPPGFLNVPGTLIVIYEGSNALYRPDPRPRRFLATLLARRPCPLRLVRRIPYSDGTPWTAIYAVTP